MPRGVGRREIVGGVVAAGALAHPISAAGPADPLLAWLRVLVADAAAPGLTPQSLRAHPFTAQHTALLASGLAWLEAQARAQGATGFLALAEDSRPRLAVAAQMAGDRSLPRNFFAISRAIAFDLYYSDPSAWSGLAGYHGPPQPDGYPDHASPPG